MKELVVQKKIAAFQIFLKAKILTMEQIFPKNLTMISR